MQTFLPYYSYTSCAEVLDWQRLGKQRAEAKAILRINLGLTSGGYQNHPCVLMWRGFEYELCVYGLSMCNEWLRRGYVDNTAAFFKEVAYDCITQDIPPWLGDEQLHSSHRATLLSKDFNHYSQFNWPEKPKQGYFWPKGK